MSDNALSGKVGLDTGDFKTGATEMARHLRDIESGFRASAAGLGDWSKSASGLELRIKALTSEIEVQKGKVEATRAEYERLAAEKGVNSRAAEDMHIKLNKENEALGKMQFELYQTDDALAGMSTTTVEAATETEKLGKEEQETTGHTSKFANALEGLKGKLHASVSGLKDMVVNVAKVGAGLALGLVAAAAGAVTGIGALLFKTAATSDELVETAEKIGITTTRLQELNYIADQTGTGVDTMQGSMAKMTKSLADATKKGTPAADAFKKLGVSVTDSNGQLRDGTDVYFDAIAALGGISNETERDILAMQLFGKSAMELNPLINLGADGLQAMSDQAHALGAVMGEETVTGMANLNDQIGGLKAGFMGLVGTLVAGFLPVAQQLVAWIQDSMIPWLQDNLPKAIQFLSNMWTTVLLPAIQSVWTWLSTVLMPFLKGLVDAFMIGFGPGVWNDWVTGISNALYSLGGPFNTLGDAIVTLSNFWNNTLLPALGNVRAYIVDNIIPRLSELWTWLQTNLPAALQNAADFWNNTLLPALGNVWAYIVDNVIPRLAEMWTWLQDNVPAAIQTAADYFNNTLLPAMTDTRNYIANTLGPAIKTFTTDTLPKWQTKNDEIAKQLANIFGPALISIFDIITKYIIPIINTLNTIYLEAQIIALGILVVGWDKLNKGLNTVGTFINDHFGPTLTTISDFITKTFNPNVDTTGGIIQNLGDAIDRIVKGALARFLKILQDIAKALLKIIIPGDIKPGSPTPFELGLRGINDAMAELSRTQLPALKMGLAAGGGYGQSVVNNSWSYVIQAANPLQTSGDLARQVRLLELMH